MGPTRHPCKTAGGPIEHEDGEVDDVSLQALTLARDVADDAGESLEAIAFGPGAEEVAETVGAYGAGVLNVVDDGSLVAHVSRGIEEPPPLLRNEYAIIPVNPARHETEYPLALAFAGYLTGPAQSAIAAFRVRGDEAFRPTAMSSDPDFDQYVPTDWPE